jgi:hypothetical protein
VTTSDDSLPSPAGSQDASPLDGEGRDWGSATGSRGLGSSDDSHRAEFAEAAGGLADHYRLAEYEAMRATIRQRGTARMVLVPAALVGWAALSIGAAAVITVALSTLIPLLVLVGAFESVFALHVNVERLGRYLQVFHERAHAGWEHVTMDYGRRFPGGGSDPLFGRIFIFATSVNFFPAALGGEPWEAAIVAVCHFVFIYRVRKAQSLAASIRAEDLRRFEMLFGSEPGGATPGHSSPHERPIP